MAILIGVVALAVLPNIQRSRESKDIQALDSIASAANAAIATTQAKGSGTIKIGDTSTGVVSTGGTTTEEKAIVKAIFDTVAAGAGKCESDAASKTTLNILLSYDVTKKKVEVAYTSSTTMDAGAVCDYLSDSSSSDGKQHFKVTNNAGSATT